MKRGSMSNSKKILQDAPGKTLFFFALPMILGNLFQQFYNMADSIIVGRFAGEEELAAVGASYALTTVFIMIAIGGGIGASVIVSQYLGAGKYREMKTAVYTALFTFLGISAILGAAGFFLRRIILVALKTPANILDMAVEYLGIYFLGLVFLFMYNILSSIFNALGDSKTPLYLLIFSSILNVVLDLVLVIRYGLGVVGVASATVFAQGVSAVISFLLLMKRLKSYEIKAEEGKPRLYSVSVLMAQTKVAIPSMLQQSIVSIGMLLVQSVVNRYGSSVLAGYSAASRIESICIVPMIATGNAVSTFTAQNMGANQPERARKGYKASYLIIASFAVLICVVLYFWKEPIIRLFLEEGSQGAAFETGVSYLSFLAFFFVLIGLKAATDGVLRGAGDVIPFTLSNLVNLGIRVTFAFLASPYLGVAAVWYAVPMGWGINYVLSLIRYLSGKWEKKKLIQE